MVLDKILVVDFGGQYAHLIARRIRQSGVYSEIVQPNHELTDLKGVKGIILSGSPYSICDLKAVKFNKKFFETKLPLLGICFGHQLIAREHKGKIAKSTSKEFGAAKMQILTNKGIFAGMKGEKTVWMSHHDEVSKLPDGFEAIGSTKDCEFAAVADFKRNWFGVQFHPEVTHTQDGNKIISNFVLKVCKAKKSWSMKTFMKEKIKQIKKQAGKKKVLMLASGGVDSTVALAMLAKALPKKQIFALHIDTGFMRKNEVSLVEESLKKLDFTELIIVNAEQRFLNELKDVIDPEKKREIIGKVFLDVKDGELERFGLNPTEWVLAQGTIYPDTIESAGTEHADKIKTHHNRVEQIMHLLEKGELIEPIAELYKDEVRTLGKQLKLPKKMINRHPFPGPGLAIRELCSETEGIEEEMPEEMEKFLKKEKIKGKLLPLKSVGVQGDLRTYRKALVIEGNNDWTALEKTSTELTNQFNEINRVVLSVYPKEIKSLKTHKKSLNKNRTEFLREADAIVREEITEAGLDEKIWQFPVILLPVSVNDGAGEVILLRPIESTEAMTAKFYGLPAKVLRKIVIRLLRLSKIDAIFLDITHKPPATIEWE